MRRLVGQRLFGLVLGYENLNDHGELRNDSLLALTAGCGDLTGEKRIRDRGHPLAGSSTLNRLELSMPGEDDRYKNVAANTLAVDGFQVDLFLEASPPKEIHLDLDCTDDPLHDNQEGVHRIGVDRG